MPLWTICGNMFARCLRPQSTMWYTNRLNWIGFLLLIAALLAFAVTLYSNVGASSSSLVTPTAPLPDKAVLQKHVDSTPASARYLDTYIVDAPPLAVIAYYKKLADDCTDNPEPAADLPVMSNALLTCVGSASPRGSYVSRIGYDGARVGSKTILLVQVSW